MTYSWRRFVRTDCCGGWLFWLICLGQYEGKEGFSFSQERAVGDSVNFTCYITRKGKEGKDGSFRMGSGSGCY